MVHVNCGRVSPSATDGSGGRVDSTTPGVVAAGISAHGAGVQRHLGPYPKASMLKLLCRSTLISFYFSQEIRCNGMSDWPTEPNFMLTRASFGSGAWLRKQMTSPHNLA